MKSSSFIMAQFKRKQAIKDAIILAYKAKSIGLDRIAESQARDAVYIANATRSSKIIRFVNRKVSPILDARQ